MDVRSKDAMMGLARMDGVLNAGRAATVLFHSRWLGIRSHSARLAALRPELRTSVEYRVELCPD